MSKKNYKKSNNEPTIIIGLGGTGVKNTSQLMKRRNEKREIHYIKIERK